MAKKRDLDRSQGLWFRTDRLFEDKGEWYFHTREKTIEGPFQDQLEAQCMLDTYIKIENGGVLGEGNTLAMQPLEFELEERS